MPGLEPSFHEMKVADGVLQGACSPNAEGSMIHPRSICPSMPKIILPIPDKQGGLLITSVQVLAVHVYLSCWLFSVTNNKATMFCLCAIYGAGPSLPRRKEQRPQASTRSKLVNPIIPISWEGGQKLQASRRLKASKHQLLTTPNCQEESKATSFKKATS